jgi:pyruvate dehydrogenase (quinone)
VAPAWEEALQADCPVLIEFKTDPEVPPLPPHITLEQAKHFASALFHVDPAETSIIANTARQILADFMPTNK